MIARDVDVLPQSAAVSALVRRIAFKLDAELRFNGHTGLTTQDRSRLFVLGDASAILDRVALMPGMAQHENRARRDLLELYDVFDRTLLSCSVPNTDVALDAIADSFDGVQAEAEAAHHAQLDEREENAAGDAQGCLP